MVGAVVLVVLGALGLQAFLNLRRVPRLARLRPVSSPAASIDRVAVLVPARNEARGIGRCVRAWRAQDVERFELIVYDDDSTDDTRRRAQDAADGDPRVRIIEGGPLPAGWRGKTHACHRLRGATSANVLVFADADVVPAPGVLRHAANTLAALDVDGFSALVSHRSSHVAVRVLVSLQHWAAFTFAPLWLPAARRRRLFSVTNGQFVVVRADAYDSVGGFAAVAASLGEDSGLGRRLAAAGRPLALVDGTALLTCYPYTRARDAWSGSVRNLTIAMFGSPAFTLAVAVALAGLYVAPVVQILLAALLGKTPSSVALAAVLLALLARAPIDHRAGHGMIATVTHPLAVAALVGMLIDSARRYHGSGVVEWRGRRYQVTARSSIPPAHERAA